MGWIAFILVRCGLDSLKGLGGTGWFLKGLGRTGGFLKGLGRTGGFLKGLGGCLRDWGAA